MPFPDIASIEAEPIHCPLKIPFAIAGGAQAAADNVFIRIVLSDGTAGYGEAAPLPAFNGETQTQALRAIESAKTELLRKTPVSLRRCSQILKKIIGHSASARAGLEMALLDAWTRRMKIPLRYFFGGFSSRLETDVTVPLMPLRAASRWASSWRRKGFTRLKIKLGSGFSEDLERVVAVHRSAPQCGLILDANAGLRLSSAKKLIDQLERRGISPILFEQPLPADDWKGMARLTQESPVPICADEMVSSAKEALRAVHEKAARAINVKLMKCGLWEALQIVSIARAAGAQLMLGGMLESHLAMTSAAHFAAGLGGFSYIDLDSPLFFKEDPVSPARHLRACVYDLSGISSGIGVVPKIFK
ncbi:MAG: dipeptide epimerase [Elusimicrobia bacterium]|nr:dipeptide epimerase [Elusimicrobiota bacterium]